VVVAHSRHAPAHHRRGRQADRRVREDAALLLRRGLLPPADRTAGGYRLYGEEDLARLARIRTLRDAGLDLATIRSVLAGATRLDEALRRRLGAVETEIAALRQVAAALRAALRSTPDEPDVPSVPSMEDLERLRAVTRDPRTSATARCWPCCEESRRWPARPKNGRGSSRPRARTSSRDQRARAER
jgi:DNA-binding transcriptional MerR regulator